MAEKKKKKQNHNNDTVDTSDSNCLLDGCFYVDFGGGCLDIRGCLDFGDGCLDFGGCFDIGDACTFAPLKFLVIVGLMLYGDWDFANRCAKELK